MKEIALIIVTHEISHEGIRLNAELKRHLGNKAKSMGIDVEELWQFYRCIIKGLFEKTFGEKTDREPKTA